jgi:hypothetical protein
MIGTVMPMMMRVALDFMNFSLQMRCLNFNRGCIDLKKNYQKLKFEARIS